MFMSFLCASSFVVDTDKKQQLSDGIEGMHAWAMTGPRLPYCVSPHAKVRMEKWKCWSISFPPAPTCTMRHTLSMTLTSATYPFLRRVFGMPFVDLTISFTASVVSPQDKSVLAS